MLMLGYRLCWRASNAVEAGYWAVEATDGDALYGVGVVVVDGTARPVGGVTRVPIEPRVTRGPLVADVEEIPPDSDDPVTVTVRGWLRVGSPAVTCPGLRLRSWERAASAAPTPQRW